MEMYLENIPHADVCKEDITVFKEKRERGADIMVEKILDSNLMAAFISLIGVIISSWYSNGQMNKKMQQALEVYKSELSRKVYISSKRADMEFDAVCRVNTVCGDIDKLMQGFYPDKLRTYQINWADKPSEEELALRIRDLENEINNAQVFIAEEIVCMYRELLKIADKFFADLTKHRACFDDDKQGRARKENLRDIAYETRNEFRQKWAEVSIKEKENMLEREKLYTSHP